MMLEKFNLSVDPAGFDEKLLVPIRKVRWVKQIAKNKIIINIEGDTFILVGHTLNEIYNKMDNYLGI